MTNYIVRNGKLNKIVSEYSVFYEEKIKVIKNKGPLTFHEGTGKFNKSNIQIWPRNISRVHTIPATAKAIKGIIRKVRPEEQKQLDDIRDKIISLQAERREVIKTAWTKGHVVTLKEAIEKIKL